MEIVNTVADENELSKAVTLFQDSLNTYLEINTDVMLESEEGPVVLQVFYAIIKTTIIYKKMDGMRYG